MEHILLPDRPRDDVAFLVARPGSLSEEADTGVPHGDIVALALDTWLRAKGYPPDLKPREKEVF